MSSLSNLRIPGNANMSATLYSAEERIARKPDRAQASFLDTIVGCRSGYATS